MLRIFTTLFTCTLFVQGFAQNVNLTFRANLTFPGQTLANICGYKDASGNEYALCGGSQGLIIVDVTNPSSPVIRTTIPEVNNLWKEIKVFRDIAYVTTEGGGGLHIINLAPLPSTTLPSQYYTGDGPINGQLNKIHALHVDTTKEFLYLFGGDFGAGGAVVCDLSADPYNPTYVGRWNVNYIHDGYVDNDTLYGAHIYAGHFSVIDFTNKTSPVLLQTQMTPGAFTHNTWLTNDRRTILATDEVNDSWLTAWDITNLSNITLLDQIQSNPGSGSMVHNTHIKDNWAVTSWYKDGITVVDITRPQNLVQVGNYDTFGGSGGGFNGAWGVYPFLPSGTVVVSNINEGLFVLTPNYVRACYLEGTAIDSITTLPLNRVYVNINTVNVLDSSNASGIYRTGTHLPGTYSVTYTKSGYYPLTWNNQVFTPGNVVNILAKLIPIGTNADEELYTGIIGNVFPNPFNGTATLTYILDPRGDAEMRITDISGKTVQQLALTGPEGKITVGEHLSQGIYFAQIVQGNFASVPVKVVKQ